MTIPGGNLDKMGLTKESDQFRKCGLVTEPVYLVQAHTVGYKTDDEDEDLLTIRISNLLV